MCEGHRPVASHDAPRCLLNSCQNQLGVKRKHVVHQEKPSSSFLLLILSSDKTAALALIALAAARLAVVFLFFFVVFYFGTNKRNPSGYVGLTENTLDWGRARWMSKVFRIEILSIQLPCKDSTSYLSAALYLLLLKCLI